MIQKVVSLFSDNIVPNERAIGDLRARMDINIPTDYSPLVAPSPMVACLRTSTRHADRVQRACMSRGPLNVPALARH